MELFSDEWYEAHPFYENPKEALTAIPSSASLACSSALVGELVDAAMEIAMFDHDWTDNRIPEVKYHRELFTERFTKIISKRR